MSLTSRKPALSNVETLLENPFPYEQNFQYDNSCDFSDSEEEIVAQQRLQFEKRFKLDFSHVRLKGNERINSTEATNLDLKSNDSFNLGQEINELIELYHLKLFTGSKAGNLVMREDGYPNQILKNVKFLHSKCLAEREKIIQTEADAAESIFHSLCTSLLKAICLELDKDLVRTDVVEHLMMSILILKSDRESLLQHLGSKTNLSSEFFSSVLRTVSNIFGNSDLEEPQPSEKNLDVTSASPLLIDTYNRVFSLVFHDMLNDEGGNKMYGNKVLRLTSLHDLAGDIPLSISNLHHLITAYGGIGNIESCMKAEEMYRANELDRSSTKLVHEVQRAYCQAAYREITKENRIIAIERGERLALEIMKKNVMNHFDRCFSISIALQMLALAGNDCVPNRIKRAENMVVNCIGEFALTQIKHARDEHIQTRFVLDSEAKLLRSLLLVYASERDMACLDRALLILRMIENDEIWKVRSSRVKRQDASHDVESPISILSLEVYQSVLHGLHRCTLLKAEPEVVLDLATRATRLLDSMETLKIVPDGVTFDTLLKIWRRVDSISSGRNADMILSKMQMREVYDKAFHISPEMYSKVLQCWENSAAKGHPQAAERAHQLLLFLEMQCGATPLLSKSMPLKSTPSSQQEKKLELGASIYNLVLQICVKSLTDNALPLAIDIHKRIHNANVIPTVEIFNSIFIIITHHLPDDLMAQLKYVNEVVILAKKNDESASLAFQALQRFHPVLSDAYHRLYSS
jgi:hypothetical protein